MKKRFFKTRRFITVMTVVATLVAGSIPLMSMTAEAAKTTSKTASDIVADMTVGWNIGNSLDVVTDAVNYPCKSTQETFWGNPITTKELIDEVAKAGFNTIRVPVTWGQYTVGDNYEIPSWWMERVREVVDYGIANNMYVILNSHHDIGGKCRFYYPEKAHEEESVKFLSSIWTQIATEFKDYDQKLIFETMNEPRLADDPEEWWFPRNNPSEHIKEAVECLNVYNQTVVDAVRAAGGNNDTRCIMVTGYDTSIDGAMVEGFRLPKDTVKDRIIMAVHAYTPYYFALDAAQPIEKFDDEMARQVDELFADIESRFVSQGVPVCISEMGCLKRANNHDERIKWCDYYMGCAEKLKYVSCVLWDNNVYGSYADNLGFIDRTTLKWDDPEFIATMMKHVDGTPAAIDSVKVPERPIDPADIEDPSEAPVPSSNLEVTFELDNWGASFHLGVTVKNTSNKTVDGWKVYLKKKGVNVTNYWSAGLEEEKHYYVFTSQAFNNVLEPGESTEFGVMGGGALSKVQLVVTDGSEVRPVEPKTEEPKTEVPSTEEPKTEVPSTEEPKTEEPKTEVPSTEEPKTEEPRTEVPSTEVPSTEEPKTEVPSTEEPTQPVASGVKASYEYTNWGSGYQYVIEVSNTGKTVDTWEIKVKKSDLTIDSSWCVNIEEKGDYYVITPFVWNARIEKGQKISFGIQGSGACKGNAAVFTIK